LEDIFRQHPEIKDIFVDGTERRVQKPKNRKRRNKLYSGKISSWLRGYGGTGFSAALA
jgi:hypothetical protein